MARRDMRKSRVLVAAAGLFLGLVLLWLRVAWLQIGMHEHFASRANENQIEHHPLVPRRGPLLDRRGRLLAQDLHTSDVAIYPPQLQSARQAAARLAPLLGEDRRRLQRRIAAMSRWSWLAHDVPPETGEAIRDLALPGVVVQDQTQREYRLGEAACEVLGRTNRDGVGADGIEYQWDRVLGGQTGWVTLVRDGRGRRIRLPGAAGRPARDGNSLTLTLDADLQGIVESHLARAVDTLAAVRGFAVFIDPATGEVLASACVPHLPPGQAKNWTVTDQYEPGSTFKVVAAGGVLEEGLTRPDEVIAASTTGAAELVPGCILHDTHKEASYTFRDAMRLSSNIVMAKMGMRLGPDRLYRYATQLGFGSMTGVEFPGESAGRLRPPNAWQPRSTPTISIGHEVTVTPLQLALAYGAIANGGILMEPMLVREERDPDGRLVREWRPQAAHRVFSEATAAMLRQFLQAVVDSGTATSARNPSVAIAGKTGTAQKFDPRTRRYGAGMYIASFAGFAPSDHPCIVGVVVVDEPHRGSHYGGQAAAPVFREIMLDLLRAPDGMLGPSPAPIAAAPPALTAIIAPDLRMLPRRAAEQCLRGLDLRVRFDGEGERVLSQSPAAGQPIERGGVVTAWLSPPADSSGGLLPDLTGLTLREALRRLSERRLRATIRGSGLVVRQDPPAGVRLPLARPVRLWCEMPREDAARAAGGGGPGVRSRSAQADPVTLLELAEAVEAVARRGGDDLPITGLALDSRRVRPGDAFFALPGAHADGATFAHAAVAAGAHAVVGGGDADTPGAAFVEVREPRLALARAAVAFHGAPSQALRIVGVTGTNGKTTTTYLLESVFRAAGWRPGVIGTTGIRIDGDPRPSAFTTPEAPELQAALRAMVDAGVAAVAIEVSSHALELRRAFGLECDVAVFTNLTQDHLDFHGTMSAYLDAKLALFDGRNGARVKHGVAVVNLDDPSAQAVLGAARRGGMRIRTFGESPDADVRILAVEAGEQGIALVLRDEHGRIDLGLPMLGRYNAWNAAAAFAAACALHIGRDVVAAGLARTGGVPGRLERVDDGGPFTVVVDYAHTPDALERALAACREHARGRVLLVFGCGGDRDAGKRGPMGAIAARGAGYAWVTNDNPRGEDPARIAADIVAGAPDGAPLTIELDRRVAIGAAIHAARPGDVVLIAGKGHETTQTIAGVVTPFDDRRVARERLAAGGGV